MLKNSVKPFELLTEYERLSLKHKVAVEKIDIADQWSGVGFKVDETNFVLAIDQIVEVLIITETTKIPGISSWVLGLGNIRGNLLPLIDFKSYLYSKPTKITAHTRMVVINQQAGQIGLVVDEVFGQKHFQKSQLTESNDSVKYSKVAYKEDEEMWYVLEAEMLINDSAFQNAAAI